MLHFAHPLHPFRGPSLAIRVSSAVAVVAVALPGPAVDRLPFLCTSSPEWDCWIVRSFAFRHGRPSSVSTGHQHLLSFVLLLEAGADLTHSGFDSRFPRASDAGIFHVLAGHWCVFFIDKSLLGLLSIYKSEVFRYWIFLALCILWLLIPCHMYSL